MRDEKYNFRSGKVSKFDTGALLSALKQEPIATEDNLLGVIRCFFSREFLSELLSHKDNRKDLLVYGSATFPMLTKLYRLSEDVDVRSANPEKTIEEIYKLVKEHCLGSEVDMAISEVKMAGRGGKFEQVNNVIVSAGIRDLETEFNIQVCDLRDRSAGRFFVGDYDNTNRPVRLATIPPVLSTDEPLQAVCPVVPNHLAAKLTLRAFHGLLLPPENVKFKYFFDSHNFLNSLNVDAKQVQRAIQDSLQDASGRDERGEEFYGTIKKVCEGINGIVDVFDKDRAWAEHAGIETVAGAEVNHKGILKTLKSVAERVEFPGNTLQR